MKPLTRRESLVAIAGGFSAIVRGAANGSAAAPTPPSRLGIVIYALGIHQRANWSGRHHGLAPAVAFLEECRELGAGGIQCSLGAKDAAHARDLRQRAERHAMHVEVTLEAPRDAADVARFENDVKAAKEAGATVARAVLIPGRRYERFQSLEEFRDYEKRGLQSLQRAEPVLARQRFRLAVENHKDQRIPEKLALLKSLSSEWIGLCVDVGNNLALLEDPLETVRAFSPWAFTVHLKDAAVREADEGFLLADAALGEGILPLPVMVQVLRQANPAVRFNLETITRDALNVPAKTEAYWATLSGFPRSDLDAILKTVRAKSSPAPFPPVTGQPLQQQLARERRNIEQSLKYARERLNL